MSKIWLFADYEQAEARIVAWAGKVPTLMKWFRDGEDVHLNVLHMLAREIQRHKLDMPTISLSTEKRFRPFVEKPWNEYTADDPDRDLAKNTVYGNNYGMGRTKFAMITGLPEKYAGMVQEIYFSLFPEIRTGYHTFIDMQLRRNACTVTLPLGPWPRTFYGIFDDDMRRVAYAWYAASTVGLLMTRCLVGVREAFQAIPTLKLWTPSAIMSCGINVGLQIHDAIGVRVEDTAESIYIAASLIKKWGEHQFLIRGENFSIPIDFKIGPTWAKKDLQKYKFTM